MNERRLVNDVGCTILSSLSFTDTSGIHHYSHCFTFLSQGGGFFVDADEIVKRSRQKVFMDLLFNRILT